MLNNVNLQNPNKTDLILEALNTMSGDIVTFDGVGGMPLKKLKVNIEPVQAGSGDPSPDNIRPITGWTVVKITRTGKNLLGGDDLLTWLKKTYDFSVQTDANGRYISFSATNAYSRFRIEDFPFKENTQYSIIYGLRKTNPGSSNLRITYTDGSHDFLPGSGTTFVRRLIVSGAGKTISRLEGVNSRGTTYLYLDDFGIFEGVLDVDDFVPYEGETFSIEFPVEAGTIYGGNLDFTGGILTVTHGNIAEYAGEELPGAWISSMDVYEDGSTPSTGAQVVYELAEPVIYQLNPEKVTALLGENNIWADSGDVVVQYGQYLSTLKEYIDAKVADLQAQIDSNEEVTP